jgi:hypothetical protein
MLVAGGRKSNLSALVLFLKNVIGACDKQKRGRTKSEVIENVFFIRSFSCFLRTEALLNPIKLSSLIKEMALDPNLNYLIFSIMQVLVTYRRKGRETCASNEFPKTYHIKIN